ncbi:Peptidase M1 membrane alanine aminopeptidase [Desulfarculus baarsii DSM 2075]|uniref:Peptidase M1 membrane alanine aminopeptidase n=1 Tax=Desulfarculus baarsii (strain ATCC 33931 / DSM 2075 / LMG 7858 / VKM B-1802 / 2st14) TaxID=644282 RepID=E1QKY3_DESB2|nr:DUF3458 domain-containing protein [Desulfarculus baarsii]ADK86342.1 Peptidase M1 membrane alanine aminopeptidase [Desulfarculus baarsii DSM 2075]
MASQRKFKYHRQDFGPLPVRLRRLDIHLSFWPERVDGQICLDMAAVERLDQITLDAKDLEIQAVERVQSADWPTGWPLEYDYQTDRDKLVVYLEHPVIADQVFRVRIRCACRPSEHILEGIYRDVTPPGAPQQYMSQCQQWGFQRILPIFDDCRAKCAMTTTLEGDARYTHMISNGNIDRALCPDGRPTPKPGDPSRRIIRFHNPVPMAPYLFIACAGAWDELADEVTLPNGHKVRLEYLVPPGQSAGARLPMAIAKQSVEWIARTQDYLYPNDAYRTICMGKSNFGGMENVGNTTIVTDAALIDEHTLDPMVLYAHAVIVHEFEHNQCGSETTMATPFDVWLNEAYTVDVERQFMADQFGAAFARLREVDSIRDPLLGPLALEDGGHVGRIVRDGFNDPDELIDGVTYVKAAEVIGMLRLIVGQEAFRAGKSLYFARYKDANADSDQFFACFEEAAGRDLNQFKTHWLHAIGYPTVRAATSFDPAAGRYVIKLEQRRPQGVGPFHLPISLALVDERGQDIAGTARVIELRQDEAEVVFEGLTQTPALASINRGYSFYGVFEQDGLDNQALAQQARLDPDEFNRLEAMRRLTDRQRVRLLHELDAALDEDWLAMYGLFLADEALPPALKAYFLRIDEQPLDRAYLTWHPELVAAQERLKKAVNGRWRAQLVAALERARANVPDATPKDGIAERMLAATLLDLIASDDSPASHELILHCLATAKKASERVGALALLNRSSHPARLDLLERAYHDMHGHLSGYANYLRVIAGGDRPDVFEQIERERRRPSFDICQPTWARALYVPMAANNKALWTAQGVAWLGRQVVDLAQVSTTTASRMLSALKHVARLRQPLQGWAAQALEEVAAQVAADASPTIHGQAKAYLEGLAR